MISKTANGASAHSPCDYLDEVSRYKPVVAIEASPRERIPMTALRVVKWTTGTIGASLCLGGRPTKTGYRPRPRGGHAGGVPARLRRGATSARDRNGESGRGNTVNEVVLTRAESWSFAEHPAATARGFVPLGEVCTASSGTKVPR